MTACIARNLFGFKKGCQLFVRSHDVAFAIVAVSVNNGDPASLFIDDRDAAQLQPDLLRRSAMISQYFIVPILANDSHPEP